MLALLENLPYMVRVLPLFTVTRDTCIIVQCGQVLVPLMSHAEAAI